MPSAVRLSDELVELARAEAAVMHRSIAMQIEHWAQLGRQLERAPVSVQKVREFLAGQLPVDALSPEEEDLSADSIFNEVLQTSQSVEIENALKASGQPYFVSDVHHPGQIIRISPDGTRQRGVFQGSRFVADEHTE